MKGLLTRQRGAVALVTLALLLYPAIRPYDIYPQTVMLLAFLLAIQAVSWNIISGYAGYISLGHSVFLGLGGTPRRSWPPAPASTRWCSHPSARSS